MNINTIFPATIMPDKDWWHALWPNPEVVLTMIGIEPNMDIVDLCCGNGHFTKPMCELVYPGKTWALEIDPELLKQCKLECKEFSNFQAILGDARQLAELIGEPIDYILVANTFHGVPDKPALVKAVHESLKPSGQFAVINWQHRPREETTVLDKPRGPDTELRMHPVDVQRIVEPMGFASNKVIDVGPYHYAAVFVKNG